MSTGENAKRRAEADESQRLKDAADEDRRKRIVHRFRSGDTVPEITASIGKSQFYVRTVLREAGLSVPAKTKRRKVLTQVIADVKRGTC